MGQVWPQSALWIGLALAASIISIRVAISVALIEILWSAWSQATPSASHSPNGSIFSPGLARSCSRSWRVPKIDPGVARKHFRFSLSLNRVEQEIFP
jgi:hypothetical protein